MYAIRSYYGKIMSDASIRCTKKDGTSATKMYSVEFVTTVCQFDDIEDIQQIIRDLRTAGGICNDSTGIHIHINAEPYDAKTLRNLVNIISSKENMIYRALQVDYGRQNYCKKVDRDFLERLNKEKPNTMEKLKNLRITSYNVCYTKLLRQEFAMSMSKALKLEHLKLLRHQSRITSYNVCYTKLLRTDGDADGDAPQTSGDV